MDKAVTGTSWELEEMEKLETERKQILAEPDSMIKWIMLGRVEQTLFELREE